MNQLAIIETNTFDQILKISAVIARGTLVPKTLQGQNRDETEANVFRVTEQAYRWGMSPFAVIDHASVVHGRLCWEGKLVAAVLASSIGVRLSYKYSGEGENMTIVVSGTLPGEAEPRSVSGSVRAWKTDQWKAGDYEQRLSYRGARQWARRHAPEAMLGIVTDDEIERPEMRNVTPSTTAAPAPLKPNPFAAALPAIASQAVVESLEESKAESKTQPAAQDDEPELLRGSFKVLGVTSHMATIKGKPSKKITIDAEGPDGVVQFITLDEAVEKQAAFLRGANTVVTYAVNSGGVKFAKSIEAQLI